MSNDFIRETSGVMGWTFFSSIVYRFQSHKSVGEIQQRLTEAFDRSKRSKTDQSPWKTLFKVVVAGVIVPQGFRMCQSSNGEFIDGFAVMILEGSLTPNPGGTLVEARFRIVHPWTIIGAFLLYLIAVTVFFMRLPGISGVMSIGWIAVFYLVSFLGLGSHYWRDQRSRELRRRVLLDFLQKTLVLKELKPHN